MTKSKRSLPDPMELAKLAILLRQDPNTLPADAVKGAMEFYIEAVILYRECAALSPEELAAKFRNKRQLAIERTKRANQARWQDTLELDSTRQSDPVRDYLGGRGVRLKTVPKVLEHVRQAWSELQNPLTLPQYREADAVIGKKISNGKTIYLIPRFLLEAIVAISKNTRKRSRQKSRAKSRQRKAVK